MRLTGVHHVAINVDDVDAALAFYVDTLGLEVRSDRPASAGGGAWLNAGGQQVHLIKASPPPRQGQHFAFAVDDLAAVVAELRGRGLEVAEPRAVGTTNIQTFLHDPAGNVVKLNPARVSGGLAEAVADLGQLGAISTQGGRTWRDRS